MSVEFLTHPALGATHGFFTRRGGVSVGPHAALNCGQACGDDPDRVRENRARVAAALSIAPDKLLGLRQVHGAGVVTVSGPWAESARPEADAMVTARPGLGLGVLGADCAPVLFADRAAGVVGAAHAGWRGALAGVLETTVAAMRALGARGDRIAAVVGPCIRRASYEVGADLRTAVLAECPEARALFRPTARPDRWLFDLAGFCDLRLRAAGVAAHILADADTVTDPARFFSHRRQVLGGGGPTGRQIAAIAA